VEIDIMKNKIYIAFMLGLIGMGTLYGCGYSSYEESTIGTESTFEELDVDYTTNDDGTYTYKDNIYKYKIEVSGIEGESQAAFIILTNDEETSFEDISYSLKKAEASTGIPEFVVLGWY
jgi:hypothetical protein